MTIHFYCLHCGAQIDTPDHYAGQAGSCRDCGGKITVPESDARAPVAGRKDVPQPRPVNSPGDRFWQRTPVLVAMASLIAMVAGAAGVLVLGSFNKAVAEKDFTPLFNGKNLSGWEGATGGYSVENGELVGRSGGNIFTAEDYADFVLRFEFKLTPGANSGLGIHMAPGSGDAAYQAIEVQILDDTADKYKDGKPFQYHGSVYGIVPAKRGHLRPVGEWNQQEVTVDGSRITVKLNGAIIVDADVREASKNGTMDGRDHPGISRTTGRIGFLGHGDQLYFRNIRIKRL